MVYIRALLSVVFIGLAGLAQAEMKLVMAEEDGCIWCERWNRDIGPIYPKTTEGKAAPLFRLDIHDPLPENMEFARSLHFTPTFVLMVDGKEISRIEGYPGEDFFWGLLGQIISAVPDEKASG